MGGLLALFFPLLPKATGEIGTIDNYGAEGPRDPVPGVSGEGDTQRSPPGEPLNAEVPNLPVYEW